TLHKLRRTGVDKPLIPKYLRRWRGGRVVEGGGLLNRCTGIKPVPRVRIPSSPPSPNPLICRAIFPNVHANVHREIGCVSKATLNISPLHIAAAAMLRSLQAKSRSLDRDRLPPPIF